MATIDNRDGITAAARSLWRRHRLHPLELRPHAGGRYGRWGYHWTDESFSSGEEAAQEILDRLTG